MNVEQEKKPAGQALAGGRDAADELTDGELEQVSGGARSVQTLASAPKRPGSRGTESD